MLKRVHRLSPTNRGKHARFLTTPLLKLKFWPTHESVSTFGFVVSKRIDKRATRRNHLRRLMQHTIQERLSTISPGYSFLFSITQAVSQGSEKKLEEDISFLLRQAGVSQD